MHFSFEIWDRDNFSFINIFCQYWAWFDPSSEFINSLTCSFFECKLNSTNYLIIFHLAHANVFIQFVANKVKQNSSQQTLRFTSLTKKNCTIHLQYGIFPTETSAATGWIAVCIISFIFHIITLLTNVSLFCCKYSKCG